jgi:K+-transporting ATPase ATPase C chain
MSNLLRPALVMTALMTLLTGLAYPLAMTVVANAIAPSAATGSLITKDGVVIGSTLIGQNFTNPGYLHPRPSASDYNAAATGASNLGPTSAALVAAVKDRRAAYLAENGAQAPIDAVTTSASGLDPDISPENATDQAARIAKARGVDAAQVQKIIDDATEGPFLGIYGLPRVNVLETNMALDAALPPVPPAATN